MNNKRPGIFDATVNLQSFSIISYLVDPDLLAKYLPDFLKPQLLHVNGNNFGLISAVTFSDSKFRFGWMWPFYWPKMWQTNFRAYVIDKRDNTHCVWFFQTMLGSLTSCIPSMIWSMPWRNSSFTQEITDEKWMIKGISKENGDIVEIDFNLTQRNGALIGFDSPEIGKEILCNPSTGYYYKRNGEIGYYSIWHDEIKLKFGTCQSLNFSTFSRLGLVKPEDMNSPHSIIYTHSLDFNIYLPPGVLKAQQLVKSENLSTPQ